MIRKSIFTINFLICMLFYMQIAGAEGHSFRTSQYTTEDGLSDNSVRTMLQDSNGFMWFGLVNRGLCWFDGNEFGQVLDNEQINSLTEDPDGHLWITTLSGPVYCFDFEKGRIVDFNEETDFIPKYKRVSLIDGSVWLWDLNLGCMAVKEESRQFSSRRFSAADGDLPSDMVTYVERSSDGRVWIGTRSGLCRTDGQSVSTLVHGGHFVEFCNIGGIDYHLTSDGRIMSNTGDRMEETASLGIEGCTVSGAIPCGDGKWLIQTNTSGAYVFDPEDNGFSAAPDEFDLPGSWTTRDNLGDMILMSSGSGTVLFRDSNDGSIHRIEIMEDRSAAAGTRFRFFRDEGDRLWITARNHGLVCYDIKERTQELVSISTRDSGILSSALLYSIADRNGHIWVASEYSGIYKLTPVNDWTSYVRFGASQTAPGMIRSVSVLSPREIWVATADRKVHVFSSDMGRETSQVQYPSTVYCAMRTSRSDLVVGTNGAGLFINGENFTHSAGNTTSICSDNISAILEDGGGRIWVGTPESGICVGTQRGGRWTFRTFTYNENGSGTGVRSMALDAYGNIWVATEQNGVMIFDPEELISAGAGYMDLITSLPTASKYIEAVFRDSAGRMWVAETGKGLCTVIGNIRESYTIRHLGADNGLTNVMVHGFTEDRDGHIWAMTSSGVAMVDPDTESVETHSLSAELLANQTVYSTAAAIPDGRMIVGTGDGLAIFDPAKAQQEESSTRLTFTGIDINGSRTMPGDEDYPGDLVMSRLERIVLPYRKNSFTIRYSALNYRPGTRYSSYLEGYESDWSPATSSFSASYKNVRPGRFTFHVRTVGEGDDAGISIPIRVRAPFYASIWAIVLYALLLAAISYQALSAIKKKSRMNAEAEMEERFTQYKSSLYSSLLQGFRDPVSQVGASLDGVRLKHGEELASDRNFKAVERGVGKLSRMVSQMEKNASLQKVEAEAVPETRNISEASSADKEFLSRIDEVLDRHLDDPDLTIDAFAAEMSMGRTAFYNRVSSVTGYSPNNYIRNFRMKRAAELLTSDKHTAAEVGYMVGIRDASYFSKLFKDQFGMTPKEYQRKFTIFA